MNRSIRSAALALAALGAVLIASANPAWAAGDDKYQAAQQALERRDFKAAIIELDKLLSDNALQAESRAVVLFNRAQAHMALKDTDAALADFNAIVKLDPAAADAWMNIGMIHQQRGQYLQALDHHRTALTHALAIQTPTPLPIIAYNNLAWLLATCPIDNCRDGKTALENAQKSLELLKGFPQVDGVITAGHYDTLGAAYAETGDFEKAVESQQRAIELTANKTPDAASGFTARLESYRAKKPWRLKSAAN